MRKGSGETGAARVGVTSGGAAHPSGLAIGELLDRLREAVVVADAARGEILYWNRRAADLFGYDSGIAEGLTIDALFPDFGSGCPGAKTGETPGAGALVVLQLAARRSRGERIRVDATVSEIVDQAGQTRLLALLHEVAGPEPPVDRRLEAQKLDAVGTLAAGIAHEYNNLLMAITGFSELLLNRLPPESPERRYVGEIRTATDRAASLTHQLLAFGRKQMLAPRVLNLNDIVALMAPTLRRRLGDSVQLVTLLAPGLGRVEADPIQLEEVISQLAINGRDAMPEGGTLTIRTGNAEIDPEFAQQELEAPPGGYITLQVSDTGAGIRPEIQSRLFEPFFTTKEVGSGTGLGLATVHGFIRQSGGQIIVASTPDRGTTFTIYLPRLAGDDAAAPARPARVPASAGAATVLVAEDEEMVRELIREVLESDGFRVLVARHAPEAVAMSCRPDLSIDLLVTDVAMPGMHGPELAERLSASHPSMKVLYMSGYGSDEIARFGVPEPAACLLKPFSPHALVRKVRKLLGSER